MVLEILELLLIEAIASILLLLVLVSLQYIAEIIMVLTSNELSELELPLLVQLHVNILSMVLLGLLEP